jgi:hypothetical protein
MLKNITFGQYPYWTENKACGEGQIREIEEVNVPRLGRLWPA